MTTNTDMSTKTESIKEALYEAMGVRMESRVADAIDLLEDDDIVAFSLVAIRKQDGVYQNAFNRTIDPDAALHSRWDSETFTEKMHEAMCITFDEEIRDR